MTPIDCANVLKTELRRCAAICRENFGWTQIELEIRYDVRGTVAGCAYKDRRVRFNILLLMEQVPDDIRIVAAHEFAHIATHRRWRERTGADQITNEMHFSAAVDSAPQPHGREWRRMMMLFGYRPKRCHNFDVSKHRRGR